MRAIMQVTICKCGHGSKATQRFEKCCKLCFIATHNISFYCTWQAAMRVGANRYPIAHHPTRNSISEIQLALSTTDDVVDNSLAT
jgi:hypothetical protein